jgi:L-lactate dehydrogenase complex protein LldG
MTNSREAILRAIRENRPAPAPLPEPLPSDAAGIALEERFADQVEGGGGTLLRLAANEVEAALRAHHPDAERVASTVPRYVRGTVDLEKVVDPHELASLDLFVCEGELGVAENGAIWVPESALFHRAAPFIAQHLAIILERGKLVGELQEAYATVSVDHDGYGVFIAGPSKTADIEQSLVIGAHGPRSLTVILL